MGKADIYLQMADSERQTIWSRYNAMLVTQSILLAAATIAEPMWLRPLLPLIGLLICVVWWEMNEKGWTFLNGILSEGASVKPDDNPVRRLLAIYGERDKIRTGARLVIIGFMILNFLAGVAFLSKYLEPAKSPA